MTDDPDRKGGSSASVLSAAEQLVAESAGAFLVQIEDMGVGTGMGSELTMARMRHLRRALLVAYQENDRVLEYEKRNERGVSGRAGRGKACGTEDTKLDLAAARDEIGRRLARLRAAGSSGKISSGAE